MKLTAIRWANLVILILLISNGQLNYCWYLLAMHVSLEVLNHQPLYLARSPRLYNSIFWLYEGVLLLRMRTVHGAATTEWWINNAEHLCFGILICTKIYIYAAVFSRHGQLKRLPKAIIAIVVFNLIGVFNEFFQNQLAHRSLFLLIDDSRKDIGMNLIGTTVFLLAVLIKIQMDLSNASIKRLA